MMGSVSIKNSVIYTGRVFHKRFRPRRHKLGYSVFSVLLDIDELELLDRSLGCFSYNSWNIFSFHDRDFGCRSEGGLRAHAVQMLRDAGVTAGIGRISLLCYPRIFGYAFNPLSIYFCYSVDDAAVIAILYEVHNTFGQSHTYVFKPEFNRPKSVNPESVTPETVKPETIDQGVASDSEQWSEHGCSKLLHVSPFAPMQMNYQFRVNRPSEKLNVSIAVRDAEGLMLTASFMARRHSLTQRRLCQFVFLYPLMTAKVTLGIHWEALLLWCKGVPWFSRSVTRLK